jgi:hypothetical protein
MILPSSLQAGHCPVPLQFGHLSSSELRAVFRPVPKHRWHSPVPPQSLQRRRPPKRTPSDIMMSLPLRADQSAASIQGSVPSWSSPQRYPFPAQNGLGFGATGHGEDSSRFAFCSLLDTEAVFGRRCVGGEERCWALPCSWIQPGAVERF